MNEIINDSDMIAFSGLEVKRFFENHPKKEKIPTDHGDFF